VFSAAAKIWLGAPALRFGSGAEGAPMATQIDPRYPEMLPGAGSFVTFKRAPGPLVDFSRPALGQPHAGRGLSEHSAKIPLRTQT